jgi:hypothetical protein
METGKRGNSLKLRKLRGRGNWETRKLGNGETRKMGSAETDGNGEIRELTEIAEIRKLGNGGTRKLMETGKLGNWKVSKCHGVSAVSISFGRLRSFSPDEFQSVSVVSGPSFRNLRSFRRLRNFDQYPSSPQFQGVSAVSGKFQRVSAIISFRTFGPGEFR